MGYADVSVLINGIFGVMYRDSPIKGVPISETRAIEDSELAFLAKPVPIHPMWNDFQIDGQGLFEACKASWRGTRPY